MEKFIFKHSLLYRSSKKFIEKILHYSKEYYNTHHLYYQAFIINAFIDCIDFKKFCCNAIIWLFNRFLVLV